MYKLRRYYFDQVGHAEAFYRDITVNLVSGITKQAEHTVLQLRNFGGKTTQISLIYSCLEPSLKEFIQTKQRKSHEFHQYFTPEPGLILLELEGAEKNFLVGQYVHLLHNSRETKRYFFTLEEDESLGFTFEEIPSLGRKTLQSAQSVKTWIDEMNKKAEGRFHCTDTQEKWRTHLEVKGFDRWLILKQMQFCHAEGGILEFANFKSERDFLSMFFAMTIDTDETQEVRRSLKDMMKDHQQAPRDHKQLELIRKVKERWGPVANACQTYRHSQEELEQNLKEASSVEKLLLHHQQKLIEEKQEVSTSLQQLKKQKEDLEQTLQTAQQQQEAAEAKIFEIRIENGKQKTGEVQQEIEGIETEIHFQQAVELYKKICFEEETMKECQQTLDEIDQKNIPLFEKMKRAEAALCFKHQQETQFYEQKWKETQQTGRGKKEEKQRLEKDQGKITQQLAQNKAEQQKQQSLLEKARKKLHDLKIDQILKEEQSPEQGLAKVKAAIQENQDKIATLQFQKEEKEKELASSVQSQKKVEKTLHEITREIDRLEDWLSEKGEKAIPFLENGILKHLCQGETPLLDNNLLERIQEKQSKTNTELREEERKQDDVKDLIYRFTEHGSLLIDENVKKALDYLHDQGIRDAIPYPAYLSSIYNDDVEKIQSQVESNPGRYLGIALQNHESLEKVEGLSHVINILDRPVMVSLAEKQIQPEQKWPVLPPADISYYSEKAVEKKLIELKEQSSILEKKIQKLTQENTGLNKVCTGLANYLDTYSPEIVETKTKNLEDYQTQRDIQHSLKESYQQKQDQLQENLTEITSQQKRLQEKLREDQERKVKLESFLEDIWEDACLAEPKIEDLEKQIKQDQTELGKLQHKVTSLGEELDTLYQDVAKYEHKKEEHEKKSYGHGLENFSLDQEEQEILREQSIENLERQYKNASGDYQSQSNTQRVATLKSRYDIAEKNYQKLEGEYHPFIQKYYLETRQEEIQEAICQSDDVLNTKNQGLNQKLEKKLNQKQEFEGAIKILIKGQKDFKEKRNFPMVRLHLQKEQENQEFLEQYLEQQKQGEKQNRKSIQDKQEQETQAKGRILKIKEEFNDLKLSLGLLGSVVDEQHRLIAEKKDSIFLKVYQKEVGPMVKHCQNLAQTQKKELEKAEQWLKKLKASLDNDEAQQALPSIAKDFERFTVEEHCRSHHLETITNKLNNIGASLQHKIQEADESMNVRTGILVSHTQKALRKLQDAIRHSHLPETVPMGGGKPVLKVKFNPNSLTETDQRDRIKQYVMKLITQEGGRLHPPEVKSRGDYFTADLVGSVAAEPLGIRFIKLGNRIEYNEVSKISGSGAQTLICSLLLYLVISKIRSISLRKEINAGFLMLDNPFAQMNHLGLVAVSIQLAQQLGWQLIFLTGHRDLNAFEQFPKLVAMYNGKIVDTNNHRSFVEVEKETENQDHKKWIEHELSIAEMSSHEEIT